jgi:hypothetical protein
VVSDWSAITVSPFGQRRYCLRPHSASVSSCTLPPRVLYAWSRKLEGLRDSDIAAELRVLALRVGKEVGTRDVHHSIGLVSPSPIEPGELTVTPDRRPARRQIEHPLMLDTSRPAASPQASHRAVCIPFSPRSRATLQPDSRVQIPNQTPKKASGSAV